MSSESFKDIYFKEDCFSDLFCFNVGHEVCSRGHRFGPSLRENYLIHFVVRGKGSYKVDQKTYHLGQGDFFLIRPNELIDYQADLVDPWEYYWFGFGGSEVEKILEAHGWQPNHYTGSATATTEIQKKIEGFMELDFSRYNQKLFNQAKFLEIFASFKGDTDYEATHAGTLEKRYSELFALYVKNNYYRENLTIEEIAKSMYLHPTYFSQVIKSELQLTAMEYLKSYRMNKASMLLMTTDASIEEISQAVGYQNRHSFTRAFKQKFQVSPSEYRK